MLRHKLRKLERPDENRNDEDFLCEIIDFHNTIKSWFSETANLFSLHLLAQLIGNMLMLAISVFQFDQQIKRLDINGFLFWIIIASMCISNLFLCCFLGKLASKSYEQMADALYDCNWHKLPLNLQKYLIIMIADAQIPLNYHGCGVITLNLETFSGLMRSVYTYYMMLKTLNVE
ncbi:odorant receptor 2a-like [Sitodiplosis mosellana]|uniref:odorant receptor 2a-like n=1 Tax=Sitodiplosis mosellana TaxID=263140 RepID=UPI002444F1C6|nr:odorant receptor 2a-like [Sitodiplosis mosellana]